MVSVKQCLGLHWLAEGTNNKLRRNSSIKVGISWVESECLESELNELDCELNRNVFQMLLCTQNSFFYVEIETIFAIINFVSLVGLIKRLL